MALSRGNTAQGLPDTLALPSPKEQVFFKGAHILRMGLPMKSYERRV